MDKMALKAARDVVDEAFRAFEGGQSPPAWLIKLACDLDAAVSANVCFYDQAQCEAPGCRDENSPRYDPNCGARRKQAGIETPCNCTYHVHCPRCQGITTLPTTPRIGWMCLDCGKEWHPEPANVRESLAVDHARKQGAADGFQQGWHAALTRINHGDNIEDLRRLVPGGSNE
jgi:hypothetical protein